MKDSLLLLDSCGGAAGGGAFSPNSSLLSEDDLGGVSRASTDDFLGEFGEATAPRADLDEFDIETSTASNVASEVSEASSAAAAASHGAKANDVYSYPMAFELNAEHEEEDDIIPEMEASLMPVKQERSLSFGAAEVIEYEQVIIKDEDLIGADRDGADDESDEDDDDDDIDLHFPAGAADDYRPPNRDHLIGDKLTMGFDDPFEHHHTRTEEDSDLSDDAVDELRRPSPDAVKRDSYDDYDTELREGAVNRTGFADDVLDDDLDKAEIRSYTEARTRGGERETEEARREEEEFGRRGEEEGPVVHTSQRSIVLVSNSQPERLCQQHACAVLEKLARDSPHCACVQRPRSRLQQMLYLMCPSSEVLFRVACETVILFADSYLSAGHSSVCFPFQCTPKCIYSESYFICVVDLPICMTCVLFVHRTSSRAV